jgi:hypothetical protein
MCCLDVCLHNVVMNVDKSNRGDEVRVDGGTGNK